MAERQAKTKHKQEGGRAGEGRWWIQNPLLGRDLGHGSTHSLAWKVVSAPAPQVAHFSRYSAHSTVGLLMALNQRLKGQGSLMAILVDDHADVIRRARPKGAESRYPVGVPASHVPILFSRGRGVHRAESEHG